MVGPAELELARVVDEDLHYLMEEWRPRLDRAELRRTSPILRRLLVEGDFGRAWRSLGLDGEPAVSAPSIDAMLGTINRDFVQLAIVPPSQTVRDTIVGLGSRGTEVKFHLTLLRAVPAGYIAVVIPGYPDGLASIVASMPPPPVISTETHDQVRIREIDEKLGRRIVRGQMLSAYLSSPAALADTVAISRRDVIQYVANKEGGTHYDASRDGDQGQRFELLDRPLGLIEWGEQKVNLIYAELLSIAECLSESSDAARFRAAYGRAVRTAAASSA